MAADTTDTVTDGVVHARATVRPDKAKAVTALTESFRDSTATVLTEYRGLTVKQITELRVALGAETTYTVVKNTLTKLAAAGAGLDGLAALLEGPTAVAFVAGEPVTAAKALRDYAKTHPALVIKGGVLDGKTMTAAEINKLADLESREVLLAKMAGAMKASLTQAVYLFAAPLAQVARLAGALQAKAETDPSIIGGARTPAAPAQTAPEAAPAAAPAAEAETTSDDAPAPAVGEALPHPSDQSAPAGVIAHDSTDADSSDSDTTTA